MDRANAAAKAATFQIMNEPAAPWESAGGHAGSSVRNRPVGAFFIVDPYAPAPGSMYMPGKG